MGHKISLLSLYVPCGFHKESSFVVQVLELELVELDIELVACESYHLL